MKEIKRTYIKAGVRIPTMIYEPLIPGAEAAVAVILMHSDQDYFEFAPALGLSGLGYRVFAAHFPDRTVI